MPPRWGLKSVGDPTCYKHAAPLALGQSRARRKSAYRVGPVEKVRMAQGHHHRSECRLVTSAPGLSALSERQRRSRGVYAALREFAQRARILEDTGRMQFCATSEARCAD